MKPPPFADLLETVQRDVTRVASHYPLITGFFFNVMNQPKLVEDYRWLLPELFLAVTSDIIMTLGRLFEVTDDPRTACLTTFLSQVEVHHAADTDMRGHSGERRAAFLREIDGWYAAIKATDKRLAMRRNADLAHNDLTKVGKSDIKWIEIKDMIGLAESILGRYFSAFHDTDHRFVVVNTEWELPAFLKWCRLDDYAAHRAKVRDARRAALEDWSRRKREGDPTAPDQPPVE